LNGLAAYGQIQITDDAGFFGKFDQGIGGFFFSVIWPEAIGFYLFILFAAVGGLGVALYVYYTKKKGGILMCPMGSDCNAVVTSKYSKFLGISMEYWGMIYYGLIIASYLFLIFAAHMLSELFLLGLIIVTTGAFFFSLYLLFIQAFILRQWCIWCMLSAALSIVIFIFSLVRIDFALAFLANIGEVLGLLRGLGFALGLGGSLTALFLFYRFLRDLKIDDSEQHAIKGVSELIWLGLALILVTQFTTYVAFVEILSRSYLFLVQTGALFVIAVSGAVLMIILAPMLSMIPFSKEAEEKASLLLSLRKPMFITGAIAFASWCFVFITNHIPIFELEKLLWLYSLLIVIGIGIALFWERSISIKGSQPNQIQN